MRLKGNFHIQYLNLFHMLTFSPSFSSNPRSRWRWHSRSRGCSPPVFFCSWHMCHSAPCAWWALGLCRNCMMSLDRFRWRRHKEEVSLLSLSLVLDFISFIILVSRRLFLFYFSLYFILLFCYGYSLLPYLYRVPYVHSYVHPSIRPFFLFTICFPSLSSSLRFPFRARFPHTPSFLPRDPTSVSVNFRFRLISLP